MRPHCLALTFGLLLWGATSLWGCGRAEVALDGVEPLDPDAGVVDGAGDAGGDEVDAGSGERDAGTAGADAGGSGPDAGVLPAPPCKTRIGYGSAKLPSGAGVDVVNGLVTWDGAFGVDSAGNAYATLSNGWKPFFEGRSGCIMALDQSGACSSPAPACQTRITYGAAWQHGANHPAQYDDVGGVVTWDGVCHADGGSSFARLSNGWTPYFSGTNACSMSLRYRQCDGLFTNPVLPTDCPDPGVTRAGNEYVLTCTGGRYRIYTSPDLVRWTLKTHIFAGGLPSWAVSHFWAPEIHEVSPGRWVAYFSAMYRQDSSLAVGAATATSPTGPFTDLGRPLVHDPNPGVIDAHYFKASSGQRYVLWKVDGNAVGKPTPIRIQRVAADGVTLQGSPTTILTNDQSWEGNLVEGPWMIERGGYVYLFYSANYYGNASYITGVARASSPLGPFTKTAPILRSNHAWDGPGHGSALVGPSGDWVFVYHAWRDGTSANGDPGDGRVVLVDRLFWSDGWPHLWGGPSNRSQPMP